MAAGNAVQGRASAPLVLEVRSALQSPSQHDVHELSNSQAGRSSASKDTRSLEEHRRVALQSIGAVFSCTLPASDPVPGEAVVWSKTFYDSSEQANGSRRPGRQRNKRSRSKSERVGHKGCKWRKEQHGAAWMILPANLW